MKKLLSLLLAVFLATPGYALKIEAPGGGSVEGITGGDPVTFTNAVQMNDDLTVTGTTALNGTTSTNGQLNVNQNAVLAGASTQVGDTATDQLSIIGTPTVIATTTLLGAVAVGVSGASTGTVVVTSTATDGDYPILSLRNNAGRELFNFNTGPFAGNMAINTRGIAPDNGFADNVNGPALMIFHDANIDANTAADSCAIFVGRAGTTEKFCLRHQSDAGISGTTFPVQFLTKGMNVFEIYTADGVPLVFGTNSTERMRINTTDVTINLPTSIANSLTVSSLTVTGVQAPYGALEISSSNAHNTPITQDIFSAAVGSTTLVSSSGFVMGEYGRLTFTSTMTKTFNCYYNTSIISDSTNHEIAIRIGKNGVFDDADAIAHTIYRHIGTGANDTGAATVSRAVSLTNGDYVELGITNLGGNDDLQLRSGQFTCRGL